MQVAALDGHGQADGHVLAPAGALDQPLVRVGPVRDPRDSRAHAALGARDDLVGQAVQRVQALVAQHLDDLPGADMVGRDLGADVAGHLLRGAHVPADHAQHVLVEPAGPVQAGERDEEAFLVHFAVVRGHAPPDVRVVKDAGRERHRPVFEKDRAQHADIVQVPGQQPGVVHDEDVSRPVVVERNGGDDFLHPQRHRTGLPRSAERSLDELLAAAVGEHAGVVVRVAQQAGKGRARHGGIGLVHDRHQPPPEDLERDGVEST
jgi:hypothetical protein